MGEDAARPTNISPPTGFQMVSASGTYAALAKMWVMKRWGQPQLEGVVPKGRLRSPVCGGQGQPSLRDSGGWADGIPMLKRVETLGYHRDVPPGQRQCGSAAF